MMQNLFVNLEYIEIGKLIHKYLRQISILRRKREGDHMLKTEVILSFLLILMGSIDCLTTVVGVLYSGATELNPFMAGIVSTNIGAFLAVKIAATLLIAFTYFLANRTLTENPE